MSLIPTKKEKILGSFERINKELAENIELYCEFIEDKTIPLHERWELFCQAPNMFKDHETYLHTFNIEKKYGEISWLDHFYIDKYQTVNMINIIRDLQSQLNPKLKFKSRGFEQCPFKTQEAIDDFKEEILENNLGSFINDW